MLPEIIYREEKRGDYKGLFALGVLSGITGFFIARALLPNELDIISVVFATLPLVYPLNRYFFEDEKENAPHLPEVLTYASLFAGITLAFYILGLSYQGEFNLQQQFIGIEGYATQFDADFMDILSNNVMVFGIILFAATFIGSSGAFILTWNASVLGYFLSILTLNMPLKAEALTACTQETVRSLGMDNPSPLCFVPHASFELTGFIVAGVAGSLISAAAYREDFDRQKLENYAALVFSGISMVLTGAGLEAGNLAAVAVGLTGLAAASYLLFERWDLSDN